MRTPVSQLAALAVPFPAVYIEPAPSGHGTYVGHDIVTQRLLMDVGPFDFAVTQVFTGTDGLIEGCLATLTLTIDGREVSITEAGDCDNPTQKKTQGDRLKNAASDAIKRCAMRFGVGLHLWSGERYFLASVLAKREEANRPQAELPLSSLSTKPGSVIPKVPDGTEPFE